MTILVILNRIFRTFYPVAVFLVMFCILAWSALGQGEKPVNAPLTKLISSSSVSPLSSVTSCKEVHIGNQEENTCRIASAVDGSWQHGSEQ